MRGSITVTQAEAQALLDALGEFPIKHLAVVQHVQQWLAARFAEPLPPGEEPHARPPD